MSGLYKQVLFPLPLSSSPRSSPSPDSSIDDDSMDTSEPIKWPFTYDYQHEEPNLMTPRVSITFCLSLDRMHVYILAGKTYTKRILLVRNLLTGRSSVISIPFLPFGYTPRAFYCYEHDRAVLIATNAENDLVIYYTYIDHDSASLPRYYKKFEWPRFYQDDCTIYSTRYNDSVLISNASNSGCLQLLYPTRKPNGTEEWTLKVIILENNIIAQPWIDYDNRSACFFARTGHDGGPSVRIHAIGLDNNELGQKEIQLKEGETLPVLSKQIARGHHLWLIGKYVNAEGAYDGTRIHLLDLRTMQWSTLHTFPLSVRFENVALDASPNGEVVIFEREDVPDQGQRIRLVQLWRYGSPRSLYHLALSACLRYFPQARHEQFFKNLRCELSL